MYSNWLNYFSKKKTFDIFSIVFKTIFKGLAGIYKFPVVLQLSYDTFSIKSTLNIITHDPAIH